MNPAKPPRNQYLDENLSAAGKKPRSEAVQATISDAPDPQHPPRRRRSPWLLVPLSLLLLGVGRAAWPVIDISAVAQLAETVRLAGDTLSEMTTAKDVLLGQVANFTGIWDDLTGDAYQLGENASSLVTDFSLANVEARLSNRISLEDAAWPSPTDIRDAYAGEDSTVIDRVLDEHQAATINRDAMLNPWRDSQIVIAETGKFLTRIESTASTQNAETTPGLGAQLDRQIAVTSSLRDIAAKQLEIDSKAEHREFLLNSQRYVIDGQLRQQALRMRIETQDTLDTYEADFDAAAFDQSLYTPVLPGN